MPLSSNSLIHLTKNKDGLIGILQEAFKIKFCFEEIVTPNGKFKLAVPMVSFCDIPLSEIKNHIKNYGDYEIGLKKDWAIKNGLNPVLYIDSNSTLGNNFRVAFENYFKGKSLKKLTEMEACAFDVLRYLKNYQRDLDRDGKIIKDYRFSDEREWRYVPCRDQAPLAKIPSHYASAEKKAKANETISQLRLQFEPNDITYIIIKKESEINDFINVLRQAKFKYSPEDVDRLVTRIITVEQIKSDF